MKSDIKEKWVAALRSGEYKQTKGYLKVTETQDKDTPLGNCCLGVLCEIAIADGLDLRVEAVKAEDDEITFTEFSGGYELPPRVVVDWAGLESSNPDVNYTDELGDSDYMSVAELNDAGYNFSEIADWIEKSL